MDVVLIVVKFHYFYVRMHIFKNFHLYLKKCIHSVIKYLFAVFGRKDNMIVATVYTVTLMFIVHIYMVPKEDIGILIHPQAPAWGVL